MGLAQDSAVLFAGRVIGAMLGFLVPVALAAWLDPKDYGYVSLVFVVAGGMAIFLDFGITPAHTYLLAKDRRDRKSAFLFTLRYVFVAAMLCAAVVVFPLLRAKVEQLLGGMPWPLLLYAMAGAPLLLLLRMCGGMLLGMKHAWGFAALDLVRWSAVAALLGVSVLLRGPTADAACQAWLIGLAVTGVLVTFWIMAHVDFTATLRSNYLIDSIVYGSGSYVALIGFFLLGRMDYLFLSYWRSADAVGLYNLATVCAEAMLFVPAAVGLALFPRAVELERNEANQRTAQAARLAGCYALLMAPLLALAFAGLLRLLAASGRPQYTASWTAFLLLLPGVIALSVDTIVSNHFQGRRLQHYNSYCVAFMVALNFVLNWLTIPRYGIEGAALSTTVSYVGGVVLTVFLFCRRGGPPFHHVLVPHRGDFRFLWIRMLRWANGA